MPQRCSRGHIRRTSYTRKDGTRVKSTCVPDTGAPGKTPKSKRILPKPDPRYSLKKYGYSVHLSRDKRQKALKKAAKKYGVLPTLRRVNLIANYQTDEKNKAAMRHDVEDLSRLYAAIKEKQSRKGGSKRSRKRSRK